MNTPSHPDELADDPADDTIEDANWETETQAHFEEFPWCEVAPLTREPWTAQTRSFAGAPLTADWRGLVGSSQQTEDEDEPMAPDEVATVPWSRRLLASRLAFLSRLPLANTLGLVGVALVGIAGAVWVMGPSVRTTWQDATYPYSSEGRSEACLNNLRVIAAAVALYRQDHEGEWPRSEWPGDASGNAGLTWSQKLAPYVPRDSPQLRESLENQGARLAPPSVEALWSCPQRSSEAASDGVASDGTGDYGLNPVLSLAAPGERPDNEEFTILLGQRKPLVPPFAVWSPNAQATRLDAEGESREGDESEKRRHTQAWKHSNLADWHEQSVWDSEESVSDTVPAAHLLTLGGSVFSQPVQNEWGEAGLWGGSLVFRSALAQWERDYSAQTPTLAAYLRALRTGKIAQAARLRAVAPKSALEADRVLIRLWEENMAQSLRDARSEEDDSSSQGVEEQGVEEAGWHLARCAEVRGDTSVRRHLNTWTKQRLDVELVRSQNAERKFFGFSQSSSWSNYGLTLPDYWTSQETHSGRYHRLTVRSGQKDLWAMLEVGQRQTPTEPRALDWRSSEADLLRRYGPQGYKRLRMTTEQLDGYPSGFWEYELERAGSPRLRKQFEGYSAGNITVIRAKTRPLNADATWDVLMF